MKYTNPNIATRAFCPFPAKNTLFVMTNVPGVESTNPCPHLPLSHTWQFPSVYRKETMATGRKQADLKDRG